MKHNIFLFAALIALLLSGCGGTLSVAFFETPTPEIAMYSTAQAQQEKVTLAEQPVKRPNGLLDTNADSETIRRAMLDSHNKWKAIWLDAVIVDISADGSPQTTQVQMWVDRLTGRFRVLSGPLSSGPETLQISDGTVQARVNLLDGTRQTQPLSQEARNANWQPPQAVSETIAPHPLDQEIDSRVSEIIFPQALAERGGSYAPEDLEDAAGEQALRVSWLQNNQTVDRLWIDTSLGIVLRQDTWGKGAQGGLPNSSIQVRRVIFNPQVPDSMYALDGPEPAVYVVDPGGGTLSPLPTDQQLNPSADALYFLITRGKDMPQLVRLPGSCITGTQPCPKPELLGTSPVAQGTIHPMVWSPGGATAALTWDGTIYTYSPYSGGVWNTVAQFPMITGEPAWSADGSWIVFSIMNEAGKDLYAVRPDGSDLHNLTNGQFNQVNHLWIDGFLANNRLVFSTIRDATCETYTLDINTGKAQPEKIADFSVRLGVIAASPGGNWLAYTDQQNDTASLSLMVMENGQRKEAPRRLAALENVSIQQVLFSARHADQLHDTWIAFVASGGTNETGQVGSVVLYAVRADGTDMHQIYRDVSIQRVLFTGDGEHLIAEGGLKGQLMILSLNGEKKVLSAPGLRPDQRLQGASWK